MSNITYNTTNILYGTDNSITYNPIGSNFSVQPNLIEGKTIAFQLPTNLPPFLKFDISTGIFSQIPGKGLSGTGYVNATTVPYTVNGGTTQYAKVTINAGLSYGYTQPYYHSFKTHPTWSPKISGTKPAKYTWTITSANPRLNNIFDIIDGAIFKKIGVTDQQLAMMPVNQLLVQATGIAGGSPSLSTTVYAQYAEKLTDVSLEYAGSAITQKGGYIPLLPNLSGQAFTPQLTDSSDNVLTWTFLKIDYLPYFLSCGTDGTITQIKPIPNGFTSRELVVLFEVGQALVSLNATITIATIDNVADKLLSVEPGFNTTTLGNKVYTLAQSYLLDALPGSYPGNGKSYKSIFFSKFKNSYLAVAQSPLEILTGQSSGDMTNSVPFVPMNTILQDANRAILCQTIVMDTTETKKELNSTAINVDVNNFKSGHYTPNLVPLYIYVFKTYFTDFTNILSWLSDPNTDLPKLLTAYKAKVVSWLEQQDSTAWNTKNWDIFHTYIKLGALGMSTADITSFITANIVSNINLDDNVNASGWLTSYRNWIDPDKTSIDYKNYNQIGGNFTTTLYQWVGHHYVSSAGGGGSYQEKESFPEAYSKAYVKDLGGNYVEDSGSCFSGTTLVATGGISGSVNANIKDISIKYDQVISSNGPRSIAAIAMPLRGQRTLYGLNNISGFQFTESHPFINADTSSGAPKYLCINPTRLLQLIPTYRDLGVGKLVANESQIQGYNMISKTKNTVSVSSIESYPAVGGDWKQPLYDLLLQPDDINEYGYYVGGTMQTFHVNSEIPAVGRYQYSAITLLNMLDIAAPAILARSQSIGAFTLAQLLESSAESVEEEAKIAAQVQFNETLGTLIASKVNGNMTKAMKNTINNYDQLLTTEEQAGDLSILTDPDVLKDQITTFLGYLNQDTGENQETGKGLDYNWALGLTFERLVAYHSQELSNCIYLGWRVFPEPDQYYEYLAVTISEIYMDADYPIDQPDGPTTVCTILTNPHHTLTKLVTSAGLRDTTDFAAPVDAVTYFELVNMSADPKVDPHRLSFSFTLSIKGAPVNFTASMRLPMPFEYFYRRFEINIYDENNTPCGTLCIDTRWLSSKDKTLEDSNKAAWKDTDMTGFAVALGRAWGDLLGTLMEMQEFTPEVITT